MKIHPIRIDFNVTPEIGRYVYVYIIEAQHIYMIDCGVAGSERQINDFLKSIGRKETDIKSIFLTHAHPDHIGTAAYFKKTVGCEIYASMGEQPWIENIDLQYAERPIPFFYALAGESVCVDHIVKDGDTLLLEKDLKLRVISTAGHSVDEVSYIVEGNAFIGDSIPLKGDIPIYISRDESIRSICKIQSLKDINTFYPAWDKTYSRDEIAEKCKDALSVIQKIDSAVKALDASLPIDEVARTVCQRLNTPMFMNNPLFLRTLQSHLTCHLRTFIYEDATTILSWCKDKHTFRLWSADRYRSFPATANDMMEQYKQREVYPLTMVLNDKVIGHILLRYPSDNREVIRFGFIIVDDVLRGKGYGKKLLRLAITYATDNLHAKKITLGVFRENLPALECYKSVGFEITANDSYMIDGEEWEGYEMERNTTNNEYTIRTTRRLS